MVKPTFHLHLEQIRIMLIGSFPREHKGDIGFLISIDIKEALTN